VGWDGGGDHGFEEVPIGFRVIVDCARGSDARLKVEFEKYRIIIRGKQGRSDRFC